MESRADGNQALINVSDNGTATLVKGALAFDHLTLLGTLRDECDNCFRSTLGATVTRDTRLGMPFATAGSRPMSMR